MDITDLGGHSGCRILLCEDDENVYVRKISNSVGYNSRLKIQKEKQSGFLSQNIKAPSVIDEGYTEAQLYYFDMEYVQGITLSEYIKNIKISDVRRIVETLINELSDCKQLDDLSESETNDIFKKKINSVSENLNSKSSTLYTALEILKNHDWSAFDHTSCHGDLTLENIIVKDGQLYFIDFLDSFFDSWILDVSTLMQDVQTMWSYRFDRNLETNAVLRLLLFRDILMDNMKKTHHEIYYEVYFALLLKLMRIIPYTKDKETYDFLNIKIESVIRLIQNGGWK